MSSEAQPYTDDEIQHARHAIAPLGRVFGDTPTMRWLATVDALRVRAEAAERAARKSAAHHASAHRDAMQAMNERDEARAEIERLRAEVAAMRGGEGRDGN